jgi:hypothetical protein
MNTNKPKPWMLNDISEEARKIAQEQAYIKHLRIGEWVNDLILNSERKRKERKPKKSWWKRFFFEDEEREDD